MINIIGTTTRTERFITGMTSFDRAFENRKGEKGFPLRGIVEISGASGVGKSTFTLNLSGLIASHKQKNIAYLDLEGFDIDFLETILTNAKYAGDLNLITDPNDEKALDMLIKTTSKDDYYVGILDSVGAISPIGELEGDLGEANMGRRAKLMAQFSRKVNHTLLSTPKTIFLINHIRAIIGGRGVDTPGGDTMKYISTARIRLKRKEEFPDGSYALEGTVIKNRFGFKDRKFYVIVLSGKGIHFGLTALYDGIVYGLVEAKRNIRLNGESYGFMKHIFEKAHNKEEDFFTPFISALSTNIEIKEKSNDTDETEEPTDTEKSPEVS